VLTSLGTGTHPLTDHSLAVLPGGSILVACTFSPTGGNGDVALARYTPSGALDTAFGPNGTGFAVVNLGRSETSFGMAVQADGKIVVGGRSAPNGGSSYDPFIARFQPDGQVDTSFGTGGVTFGTFTSKPDQFNGLTMQPDGKAVAVGSIQTGSGLTTRTSFLIARYQGDSGSSFAASSLSTQASSTTTASRETSVLAPAVASADHDLTQLATEWLRSTQKRSKSAMRSTS
jgi:uncharacterized delta-60 repeat protein